MNARLLRERERPTPPPAAKGAAKGPSKAQAGFQRGVQTLAEWIERRARAGRCRAHSEEITVAGETEPVTVKLGVWVSNTKTRRDKLTQDQRNALVELGVEWA